MTPRSLTGDAVTDALVPIAQRLIGAVRDQDTNGIDEAVGEAILATGGRCDPWAALAVVLAAMVPDDEQPSVLLLWMPVQTEYARLVAAGVRPAVAQELSGVGDENKRGVAA